MTDTPRVRPTGRGRASDETRRFPTSGSTALQPDYGFVTDEPGFDEPVRTRTAAEREAADRRAAERAANRAAGRAEVEQRRRLRVAPPMPVRVARAPFVAMLCVLVVAGVVGILVLTAKINANQFRLNNLQSQQAGLDQQEQTLQQTLVEQQSPGNLVAAAKKLGLVPAGTLAFIQLPNGKVYGLPQPASTTPSVTAQAGTSSATQPPSLAPGVTPTVGATPTAGSTPSAGTTPSGTTPTTTTPTAGTTTPAGE